MTSGNVVPAHDHEISQMGRTPVFINPVRTRPRTAAGREAGRRIGGRCAARGIYRARRRVSGPGRRGSVSFAGRSAVFRRRRYRPALLREAPRCSCLAVACGDRGVSDSTWAGGLLFGADGAAATVSSDRVRPRMPPRPPRLPQAPRQFRLRCGTPSLSPRASRTFQRSREAAACRVWMSIPPAIGRLAHPVRSAPAARRSSGVAHPCPAGASPDASPPYSRIASLRIGTSASASTSYGAAPAPDFHRLSGLPVCRDGSRPRRHRAAPTWPLR